MWEVLRGLLKWALSISFGGEPAKRKFTPSLREFYIQLEEIIINEYISVKRKCMQDFLGGQWLRLCAPSAGDLSSIPGQGTRSHMPQLNKDLGCLN